MISAVIVSPDAELARELEAALGEVSRVSVARTVGVYPEQYDLARLIRAVAPEVFFVQPGELEEALRMARDIEAQAPGTQVVAIDRACNQRTLLELMRAGVREFLGSPFPQEDLRAAVQRLEEALLKNPRAIETTDRLFTFLPSKPGVGCSTLTLNTAIALAETPNTRVLLADFDLNCGMIGFLLQLDAPRLITDAAEHAHHLDEELWAGLVTSRGQLDVLPSGNNQTGFRVEPAQIRRLLDFARRNYSVICADLSGLLEKYSLELMSESKRIFLVVTPELPALYLAREKLAALRTLQLDDRISVLLNRAQRRQTIRVQEIESMLGVSVNMEFPNDYAGVHKAAENAKPVARQSELGKRYTELGRRLLGKSDQAGPERRFVDYFSLVPGRYSFERAGKR